MHPRLAPSRLPSLITRAPAVVAPLREEPTMPRKTQPKPPRVTHLCWAWHAREKALGQRLEAEGDQAGADACRCHRRARTQTGKCRRHGGTALRGPMHHAYKHGRYIKLWVGILRRAGDALEAVQYLSTLRDELAVHKALIDHKLGEILASGPSDETWVELGASMDAVDRMRETGDRKGVAEELNRQREFVRSQRSSAIARREASALIDTHSKIVVRESRRQEREAATVSVNAFFGFVEMFTQQVNIHVSDPAERAAIAKAFSDAVRRAGLTDLVNDSGPEPTRH